MIVERWMTIGPEVTGPNDTLDVVKAKMDAGRFRRVPVMEADKLVGIITDHDLARYGGHLDRNKSGAVMTQKVVTVSSSTMIEHAAYLLLKHKIGGLPVVDQESSLASLPRPISYGLSPMFLRERRRPFPEWICSRRTEWKRSQRWSDS